jgi:hypothetical protein
MNTGHNIFLAAQINPCVSKLLFDFDGREGLACGLQPEPSVTYRWEKLQGKSRRFATGNTNRLNHAESTTSLRSGDSCGAAGW